jgi:hypothetical protein
LRLAELVAVGPYRLPDHADLVARAVLDGAHRVTDELLALAHTAATRLAGRTVRRDLELIQVFCALYVANRDGEETIEP